MSFTIRDASVSDTETLIHHRRAMWRDMGFGSDVLEAVEPAARAYFNEALPSGGYRGWLAEADAKVIGGAGVVISAWPGLAGSPIPKRAMILNVFVEPDYRRRGIARALMLTCIDWCKAQGFPSVGLHASDEGRALYESLGFEPTNEMRLTL